MPDINERVNNLEARMKYIDKNLEQMSSAITKQTENVNALVTDIRLLASGFQDMGGAIAEATKCQAKFNENLVEFKGLVETVSKQGKVLERVKEDGTNLCKGHIDQTGEMKQDMKEFRTEIGKLYGHINTKIAELTGTVNTEVLSLTNSINTAIQAEVKRTDDKFNKLMYWLLGISGTALVAVLGFMLTHIGGK